MKTMNPHLSQYFRLTRKQVAELAERYKYVALCRTSGHRQYFNTAIFQIAYLQNKIKGREGNKKTNFISFCPVSFHEYISRKGTFQN